MERRVDELLIKISGKVPVARKLAIDEDVRMSEDNIKGQVSAFLGH
jgi:hypothetical protein